METLKSLLSPVARAPLPWGNGNLIMGDEKKKTTKETNQSEIGIIK